jgi:hypothetical protein
VERDARGGRLEVGVLALIVLHLKPRPCNLETSSRRPGAGRNHSRVISWGWIGHGDDPWFEMATLMQHGDIYVGALFGRIPIRNLVCVRDRLTVALTKRRPSDTIRANRVLASHRSRPSIFHFSATGRKMKYNGFVGKRLPCPHLAAQLARSMNDGVHRVDDPPRRHRKGEEPDDPRHISPPPGRSERCFPPQKWSAAKASDVSLPARRPDTPNRFPSTLALAFRPL